VATCIGEHADEGYDLAGLLQDVPPCVEHELAPATVSPSGLDELAAFAELTDTVINATAPDAATAPDGGLGNEPFLGSRERPLTHAELTTRLVGEVLPRLRMQAESPGYITLGHLARVVVRLQGSDPHLQRVRAVVEQLALPLLRTGSLRGTHAVPGWALAEAKRRFGDVLRDAPDDALVLRRLGYEDLPVSAGTRAFLAQAWLHHRLSRAEERDLALIVASQVARSGEDLGSWSPEALAARETLILDNLWLVARGARHFVGRGLELDDLLQAGSLGLFRAVVKFKPELGYRFATYAGTWVYQAITRALGDESRLVRLPIHAHERGPAILGARDRLWATTHREPTYAAIAAAADTTEAIVQAHLVTSGTVSLDAPRSARVVERLADPSVDLAATAEANDLPNVIAQLLTPVSPRERQILALRFGLSDDSPRTLEEIGQEFGVTRERIRQLEAKALEKLKRRAARVDMPAMSPQRSISPGNGMGAHDKAAVASLSRDEKIVLRYLYGGPRGRSLSTTAELFNLAPEEVWAIIQHWRAAARAALPVDQRDELDTMMSALEASTAVQQTLPMCDLPVALSSPRPSATWPRSRPPMSRSAEGNGAQPATPLSSSTTAQRQTQGRPSVTQAPLPLHLTPAEDVLLAYQPSLERRGGRAEVSRPVQPPLRRALDVAFAPQPCPTDDLRD
jgi:RNA polymerase sigma factor (sigma-70 family)